THAVFSGNAIDRIAASKLTEVIVTDTVPIPPEKRLDTITVLSVDRIFASAIQRIHDGNSVSSLFKKENLRS
ncbi:MAG: ribose-phosphate diphosphokinase, partial [Myxococcota bacterium]